MALNISSIIQYSIPDNCYNKEEHIKKQIFIHHTAGASNPYSVIDEWKKNANKIATAFIIAGKPRNVNDKFKDGDIVQVFSSKYWAYHLGLKGDIFQRQGLTYQNLDKTSIGIELTNYGYLQKTPEGIYKTYVNSTISDNEIIELETGFRGYKYYHSYTNAQIESLRELLLYLCNKYVIPK
ncbi:MAG: N-acetylmuramoyl-L-alanine amidase, partial [Nanoarchaeota archaeon]